LSRPSRLMTWPSPSRTWPCGVGQRRGSGMASGWCQRMARGGGKCYSSWRDVWWMWGDTSKTTQVLRLNFRGKADLAQARWRAAAPRKLRQTPSKPLGPSSRLARPLARLISTDRLGLLLRHAIGQRSRPSPADPPDFVARKQRPVGRWRECS
jgi:hypothetical protein